MEAAYVPAQLIVLDGCHVFPSPSCHVFPCPMTDTSSRERSTMILMQQNNGDTMTLVR